MKISSRLKQVLSLSLVAVLAATVMPTSASAVPEDDGSVVVQVDLGAGPGDDGGTGCTGFASLDLPEGIITAAFNGRVPRASDPKVSDYLAWLTEEDENFTDEELALFLSNLESANTYSNEFESSTITITKNPSDADVETLTSIAYSITRTNLSTTESTSAYVSADSNNDGVIDLSDAPVDLTVTRRIYATSWFVVRYDANDCEDSTDLGLVLAGRGPVQKAESSLGPWSSAETPWGDVSSTIDRTATAALRLNTDILGGLISLPYFLANEPFDEMYLDGETYDYVGDDLLEYYSYWSPISFGDEGSPELRAVMNIYGSSPTGSYRTRYYYQLQVDDQQYFEGIPFFGCYFGGCP